MITEELTTIINNYDYVYYFDKSESKSIQSEIMQKLCEKIQTVANVPISEDGKQLLEQMASVAIFKSKQPLYKHSYFLLLVKKNIFHDILFENHWAEFFEKTGNHFLYRLEDSNILENDQRPRNIAKIVVLTKILKHCPLALFWLWIILSTIAIIMVNYIKPHAIVWDILYIPSAIPYGFGLRILFKSKRIADRVIKKLPGNQRD